MKPNTSRVYLSNDIEDRKSFVNNKLRNHFNRDKNMNDKE